MIEKLAEIEQKVRNEVAKAADAAELEAVRVACLGRKGALTEILRSLSGLPVEKRKEVGEKANVLRRRLEELIDGKSDELNNSKLEAEIKSEKIDVSATLAYPFVKGRVHLLNQVMEEMVAIFKTMGFDLAEGPEIETDWYNFEALNIPRDHPARDSQDTFYLKDSDKLLRTHTSPVQVRVMEKTKPPVRIIAPGRVFRNEATDASHSAIFYQIEGLAVDENITFADLKGTIATFIHRLFGSSIGVQFRPSHFQFTEPSAEVHINCIICGGKGCRVCKHTGWLEMLGCGMVHPNVFKFVKYDSEKYTGFAFGLGVERFAMLKYQVDDIRLFYQNNIAFLEQF